MNILKDMIRIRGTRADNQVSQSVKHFTKTLNHLTKIFMGCKICSLTKPHNYFVEHATMSGSVTVLALIFYFYDVYAQEWLNCYS